MIGVSEMYTTSAARDHGIKAVKKNAPNASIEDLTEDEASNKAKAVSEAEKNGNLIISSSSGASYQSKPKGGYYGQG